MTTTKSTAAKKTTAKKTTRKKATAKKAAAKKAPAKKPTPETDKAPAKKGVDPLPRGQELLPDGRIGLKSGAHTLEAPGTFVVNGAEMQLEGKVLVATGATNWIATRKCAECKKDRPGATELTVKPSGHAVLTATCATADCKLKGYTYVWVFQPGELSVKLEG